MSHTELLKPLARVCLAVDCMGGDHGPSVVLPACRSFLGAPLAKKDKGKAQAKVKRKRGLPAKDEGRPPPEPSVLERLQGQNLQPS